MTTEELIGLVQQKRFWSGMHDHRKNTGVSVWWQHEAATFQVP